MLNEEGPLRWIFGVGAGNLGSRASNAFAYDVLYKPVKEVPSIFPSYSSEYTKKYLSDIWSEKMYLYLSNVSFSLASPFSGICSVKAEMGMVGLVLHIFFYVLIAALLLKRSCQTSTRLRWWCLLFASCWFLNLIYMIFDNTQDNIQILVFLASVSGILLARSPEEAQRSIPDLISESSALERS